MTLHPVTLSDLPALESLRRALRLDPAVVRRLHIDLFKHFRPDDEALAEFPSAERVSLHSLSLHKRQDSAADGATKLLFRTTGGLLVESVILRIASGRTTLCVSSQVGCAAACDFCATGKMKVARNLPSEDILDQIVQAGQLLRLEGRSLRNIVFMGMGEPFHNEANLHAALNALLNPKLFHWSPANLLVSTVGVTDAMLRLARRFPGVNQALSLHSARQDVRERLIPLARKESLDRLADAVAEVTSVTGNAVMIEYLMLAGVNDSVDDARELVAWVEGVASRSVGSGLSQPLAGADGFAKPQAAEDVRVPTSAVNPTSHVNLIPYNPIEESPHLFGSDRARIEAFAKVLKNAGLKTTIRRSLGGDIAAACGQLVRHENKAITRLTRVLNAEC